MTGPKHRQVLIYFSRMLLQSPMTPALPCEGNGDTNFVGNAHLKWGGEAGCTRRGPFPINKFPRQYGRNVWNPGIMAQAAPAFTAAAYYIMDSASELLRTTMPTNDEVRAAARVIAQKLGHLDPDEMGVAVGESVRPVWMDWEDTARAALVAAEKIRECNS
jgi:hypothetical protein